MVLCPYAVPMDSLDHVLHDADAYSVARRRLTRPAFWLCPGAVTARIDTLDSLE